MEGKLDNFYKNFYYDEKYHYLIEERSPWHLNDKGLVESYNIHMKPRSVQLLKIIAKELGYNMKIIQFIDGNRLNYQEQNLTIRLRGDGRPNRTTGKKYITTSANGGEIKYVVRYKDIYLGSWPTLAIAERKLQSHFIYLNRFLKSKGDHNV